MKGELGKWATKCGCGVSRAQGVLRRDVGRSLLMQNLPQTVLARGPGTRDRYICLAILTRSFKSLKDLAW